MTVETPEGDAQALVETDAEEANGTAENQSENTEAETDEAGEVESDEGAARPAEAADDSADDTDDATEAKKTKRQRQRQERREREEALRRDLAAKDKELDRLNKRIAKLTPVDPNAAPDYDAAVAENAQKQVKKAEISADLEELEAERKEIADKASAARKAAWDEKVADLTHIKDFAEKVYGDPSLPFTPQIVETIADMDRGPEVAYHLANNKAELLQLAEMSPMRAAIELGKIEARLVFPKPKTRSTAPPPIKPLKGAATAAEIDLNTANYADYRRARGFD